MLLNLNRKKKSAFKNAFLYSWAALSLAALVVCWIIFSRWQENRGIEKRAKAERTQKQQEQDRAPSNNSAERSSPSRTSTPLPERFAAAKTVQLCYGVANAKTVKLEPQRNPVWPSYSRCVDVTPTKSTTYTLTIADAAGNTRTQSLESEGPLNVVKPLREPHQYLRPGPINTRNTPGENNSGVIPRFPL